MADLVDVYPYQLEVDEPEFLILKRADDKQYAGQWRMVAGKVENCEAAWQSGLRELREETGLFPDIFWSVPSINQFYEASTDSIHHIPVFAAQIGANKTITINEEHTEYKWIDKSQIASFVQWPEQQRLMLLIDKILTTQNVLEDWKIPL